MRYMQADAAMEWRACAALFAAGEVALLQEARPPSPLVVHVQALTAIASTSAASMAVKQEPTQNGQASSQQQDAAAGGLGSGAGGISSEAVRVRVLIVFADVGGCVCTRA
jgi:hypothetical protein